MRKVTKISTEISTNDFTYPIYFHPHYSAIQDYSKLIRVETTDYLALFETTGDKATSLPFSPFGGIVRKQPKADSLDDFLSISTNILKAEGCKTVDIIQAPYYYPTIVKSAELIKRGYKTVIKDFSQFIDLLTQGNLHYMERRKLNNLQNKREIKVKQTSDFEKLHHFLSVCRESQHLQINIDMSRLQKLLAAFPDRYEGWVVSNEVEILAGVIMVRVNPDIWYYFLPGTAPDYKSFSPMVILIDSLCKEGRSKGFKVLDLGVSSIRGDKQEGLFTFKQRMGAKVASRLTLTKSLV